MFFVGFVFIQDSRFVGYQPSILATATILHVIDQVDLSNSVDYQNQLLDVLKTTKVCFLSFVQLYQVPTQISFCEFSGLR